MRLAVILLSLVPGATLAGNPCFVRQKAVVKQVVQKAYVPVYYSVGAHLQVEAIVERKLRAMAQQAEYEEFRQWQAAREQPVHQQASGVLGSSCISCHQSQGLPLDYTSSEGKAAIMREVLSGRMPKGKPQLTGEQLGSLVDELFLDSGGF